MNKVLMYRKGLGLTQEEMADVLGISANAYRDKENNKREFTASEMIAFLNKIKEVNPNAKLDDIFLA